MEGIPYIREGVTVIDITKENGVDVSRFLQNLPGGNLEDNFFTHRILYYTNLPKRIKLVDAAENNPYHLFFYMIARFYYVDDGSSLIQYHYPKCRYLCNEALKHLPSRFIRTLEKEKNFEYVQTPGCEWQYDSINEPWIYDYMRNLYKHIWESTKQEKGKRIYISRNKENVGTRAIMNEDELKPVLKGLSVSTYVLENMTFVDTIRLFKSAEFVTGSHGAGLVWLVFCDPGTVVLEIYKDSDKKRHFLQLCENLGLHHTRFTHVRCSEETEESNMIVDVEEFRKCAGRITKM